ncbi:LysM domain-containing protein [Clostridium sp. MSJ-8]|uniref:LysM peptidoglycan-binding domain-containing protein n=1 Tax=Clostridium sp. MSJ-8 TaxID=2841510 RepID=UPI001C0F01F1|nr:LysM domain-containing protein [Clostridium sp. MSJ-8]
MQNRTLYHTVRTGDNLSTIALDYGVTIGTILKLNSSLEYFELTQPGNRIRIR